MAMADTSNALTQRLVLKFRGQSIGQCRRQVHAAPVNNAVAVYTSYTASNSAAICVTNCVDASAHENA